MKFKIFILSLAFLASSAIAQQAICDFGIRFVGGEQTYACGLILSASNDTEITEIQGTHLQGYTDADVFGISRINGTLPAALPSIFCSRFPNARNIYFYNSGLTAINDDSFSGCSQLTYLNLMANRIETISANAFSNNPSITFIDLDGNSLSTLPESVFANQGNLTSLDLRNNQFENLPDNAFAGLQSLATLYIQNAGLTTINTAWFVNTPNLLNLYLANNNIQDITAESFATLGELTSLSIYNNNIGSFNAEVFSSLTNLLSLDIGRNGISEIDENTFAGLERLTSLDLAGNPLITIRNGSFRSLTSLRYLYLNTANITEVEADAFEGLSSLTNMNLNFNNLEDLPAGVFASLTNVSNVGLWNNRLKSLSRNVFGSSILTLRTIDLDGNVVNALDRRIFDEATGLTSLFFSQNVCASGTFTGFVDNRVRFLETLSRCFRNFELTVDAVTDNNLNYLFFAGELPGIVARVQAEDEIQIALTPFNFPWTPMLEIIIGTANNTRSVIRRNQETDVAVVPTPGIIRANELNLFRVVWANNVILVFRENEDWPFLVHTMIDFFNVNFYGLRTPQSRATWSIQPVGI